MRSEHLTGRPDNGGFLIDKPTITTICVVTRERLTSLVACLESYLANCRRHERSPELIVADDSSSAEAADLTRQALRGLANRFNARIRYAGRQEKKLFAYALAVESGLSPEIVSFALFGDERCTLSTGANRNSLLLDTAGTLLLAVDDDTICRIAPPPGREDTLSIFPGYDPSEFWFFPERERAIQALSFADVDVLACHELQLGSGGVAMTLNGLAGDSGMASPRYYFTLAGASRDRLVASPEAYRSAMRSREIVRCVRRLTITPGPFCMTTFLGLDNRLPLPPFFPVQRNSDGIFGLMLQKCLGGSQVAFLPWVMLHAPEPARTFAPDEMWMDAATIRMADIVMDCIQSGGNAVDLGLHLRDLGSLGLADFEANIRGAQQVRNFAFITILQTHLHANGASPGFWAEDLQRMMDLTSQASAAEDYMVPRDLRAGRDVNATRQLSQELIAKFGELLEAWPAMVDAAKRLRAKGRRVSAEVSF